MRRRSRSGLVGMTRVIVLTLFVLIAVAQLNTYRVIPSENRFTK